MRNLCAEASMIPIREIPDIKNITIDQIRPIKHNDFINGLNFVKPSVSDKDMDIYKQFNSSFGSFNFNYDELDN